MTAYAPDTAIDYLLLRHEPRYSYYQSFFKAMNRIAPTILTHPIPEPTPLGPSARKVFVTQFEKMCDTAAPWRAHTLEDGFALLEFNATGFCLKGVEQTSPLPLAACNTSDPHQQWRYNASSLEFQVGFRAPCQKHGSSGLCQQCLDVKDRSTPDLWDCKGPADPQLPNQEWRFDVASGVIRSVLLDQCLTALGNSSHTGKLRASQRLHFLATLPSVILSIQVGWKRRGGGWEPSHVGCVGSEF